MKHNTRSKYVSLFVILLAAILVWVSCPIYATNQSVLLENLLPSWYEKIDPMVYENAEKRGEKYLVYVFRNDISTETINETVTKETRFDTSLYESDKFNTCIVPELERQVALFEQMNQMQSSLTKLTLGEPIAQTIEKAKQSEMNDYIMARRGVIKELNVENNDSFMRKYVDDTSDIVYRSQYTSTIIAYFTREEIEELARLDEVKCVAPCENNQGVAEDQTIANQIGTDSLNGTNSDNYNNGCGYKGDGIKIGIIELEGVYDKDYPLLKEINNVRLFTLKNEIDEDTFVPETISDHATQITSLIVG